MGDYHLHLHPHDAYEGAPEPGEYPDALIEAYVETAARRGVAEIGFSEHLYRCREAVPILGRFWEDDVTIPAAIAGATGSFVPGEQNLSLDRYVDEVVAAKDRGLPVLLGLEVDFFPDKVDAIGELLAPYPWDYLIGSVHWVGGWAVDSPGTESEFERRGIEQAHADYYELVEQLAASGLVDIIGHVDVTKKYGVRLPTEPVAWYRKVAAAAQAGGTAVEVNTYGLHMPAAELYPSAAFLAELHAAGVGLTFGSDAHRPDGPGRDFDLAVAAASAAGYTTRLVFRKRHAESVPLEPVPQQER